MPLDLLALFLTHTSSTHTSASLNMYETTGGLSHVWVEKAFHMCRFQIRGCVLFFSFISFIALRTMDSVMKQSYRNPDVDLDPKRQRWGKGKTKKNPHMIKELHPDWKVCSEDVWYEQIVCPEMSVFMITAAVLPGEIIHWSMSEDKRVFGGKEETLRCPCMTSGLVGVMESVEKKEEWEETHN